METIKLHRGLPNSLILKLCLIFLFLFPKFSFANFIEYDYFTEGERREINSPRLIDSEYESDRLAYQFLSQWNLVWLTDQNVFQYTAGSLGPTRFFTRGRFRLRENITEDFQFQISYNERGDYRTHRQSLVFEFFYSPIEWLDLSVYGSPNSLKREDDIGLSSTFNFNPNSRLRLFYTLVDFSHNKRNEDTDTYTEQPASFGLVWRSIQSDKASFIETSLKQDKKLVQVYSGGRIYSFSAIQGQFLSRHSLHQENTEFIQTEFNYYKGHEEDTLNTDQGITRWEIQAYDAMVQYENTLSWLQMLGLRFNYAQWNSIAGNVIQNDLLPHAWVRVFHRHQGNGSQNIDFGYEFTWHRAQGDSQLRSTLDKNNVLEHRLNTRYQFLTSKNTMLHLLLSFDLDKFGTGETWEGGSMQYSMSF